MKTLQAQIEAYERELILQAWHEQNGSSTGTALALGIDRRSLYARMKRYGLLTKPEPQPKLRRDLAALLRQREHDAITEALRACKGDRARAARALGVSEYTLWSKMQRHGIGGGV